MVIRSVYQIEPPEGKQRIVAYEWSYKKIRTAYFVDSGKYAVLGCEYRSTDETVVLMRKLDDGKILPWLITNTLGGDTPLGTILMTSLVGSIEEDV